VNFHNCTRFALWLKANEPAAQTSYTRSIEFARPSTSQKSRMLRRP